MLYKEQAIKIEKKKTSGESTYNTYTFNCVGCKEEIKAQATQLKTHSGKCRRCSQKGRPYEHILSELKHGNSKRGLDVSLTYVEFIKLISSDECHYCSSKVTFNEHTRDTNGNHVSRAYQLDRKDNNIGYTRDNCVVCCWECNRLKSDRFTYEEFMLLAPVMKEIMNSRNDNKTPNITI